MSSSAGPSNNNGMRSSLFGGPRRGGASGSAPTAVGGTGAGAPSNNNYRMENEEDARRENDAAMDALASDMTRLRREAQFLRGEVASQNELLDSVANFMQGARDGIVSSVGRLDQTMKKYGVKHTLMFAVAMCAAFFLLIYVMKGLLFGSAGSTTANPSSGAGDSAKSVLVDDNDALAAGAAPVIQQAQSIVAKATTAVVKQILAKEPGIEAPPPVFAKDE